MSESPPLHRCTTCGHEFTFWSVLLPALRNRTLTCPSCDTSYRLKTFSRIMALVFTLVIPVLILLLLPRILIFKLSVFIAVIIGVSLALPYLVRWEKGEIK
ncbi:MAG: hypothetical protein GXO82_06580 [Chlorobi bacterium]|nr:hypothetical protein [Chlorobiota bacterium]